MKWLTLFNVIFTLVWLSKSEIHRVQHVQGRGGAGVGSSGRGGIIIESTRMNEELSSDKSGKYFSYRQEVWVFSILSSIIVGLSGIFPLMVIPLETGHALRAGGVHAKRLKLLLSFAVGGLLGDVFLHLLPEVWNHAKQDESGIGFHKRVGLWIIAGLVSFLLIEKAFPDPDHNESASQKGKRNGKKGQVAEHIKTSGWLNLLANVIDNFTHGLAVAGSYSAGVRCGLITTGIVLLHEIPHEIGDFAILLRAGFNRWNAAKAQILTASGGILGALLALGAESVQEAGDSVAWILPFTSGGFLYIALVSVVPDLLKENDALESAKQLLLLCLGVLAMAFVAIYLDDQIHVS